MNKSLLSGRQYMSIAALIILGESIILGGYTMPVTGKWLSMLIAVIFTFVLCFIYSYILRKFPKMDGYDISQKIFGKIFGKILIIIGILFCLGNAIITLRTILTFIIRLTFMDTPDLSLGIAVCTFSFLLLSRGIEVFGRIMTIVFQLLVVLILIFILMLYPQMNFEKLMPLVAAPISEVFKGAAYNVFVITGDIVVLLGLMVNMKNDNNVHIKSLSKANAIAGFIFILIIVSTVSTLGLPFGHIVHYPTYLAFSLINIGNFITRIEVVLSTFILTASICKFSVLLYVGGIGLKKLIGKGKVNYYIMLLNILALFVSVEIIKTLYLILIFNKNYPWIKGIYQIAIPIIMAIAVTFYKEKPKQKKSFFNIFKKS
ncbi:MAG TPA: endospore germination permease [Acholeplasmataceae bacterium]|nr:endospore germination permease [Acholeplasmataceae bacterium]